ncbi:MAG: DUF805 domain-containing protein [Gammaproteobacteria bacterium]|nr:MAG: DUF805 domain-containing protein [Gammaproteobacteria bacterium]
MNWYLDVLKYKYAKFDGRARRMEFWMFALFNFIIAVVLGVVDAVLGLAILGPLYGLAVLIPSIALGVRRLHDIDYAGWWILLGFIPVVGVIILLIFFVLPGTIGDNRFGSNPKETGEPQHA